jgi:peptidoglycan glycosyltransferase
MQTSLARRQRRRRQNGGRATGGRAAASAVVIALPLFLFSTLLLFGLVGLVSSVVAYNYFAADLKPPLEALTEVHLAEQTVVYDRTNEVELARFGEFKREIVTFDEIPDELLDATTAIEDKTFWENAGFDPVGIVAAGLDTLKGQERGASTITQQLVRSLLLPEDVLAGSRYERKIKEIIQSIRLTQALPEGDDGKQVIITAYLNNNFYGNQSYGVKAAARGYFGKELKDLTLAETAILAGIPQSPTKFDLVRNAVEECAVPDLPEDETCPADKTSLVVPEDAEIVIRRNYVLDLMKTRSVLSGAKHTPAEYEAAKAEPVVLVKPKATLWRAPHFVWQVREQLAQILCGTATDEGCELIDTGGYHVVTSLDWKMQRSLEKWLYVAARAPNSKSKESMESILKQYKIPSPERSWIRGLRGENFNNAAGGILDARTGQVLAYGGSAGYYAKGNKKFQPQFDVMSDGYRQPGSAIKPVNYAIGIEDRIFTAASVFMDVTANFAPKGARAFIPTQADGYERGPVRLRSALQFSLNIPAVKSGIIMGLDHELAREKDFGLEFLDGTYPVQSQSIGTLVTPPADLLSAYAALANGGKLMPRQTVLEIYDAAGKKIWPTDATPAKGTQVVSPETAFIITDILEGNTIKSVNPYWAKEAILDGGKRRPAAYKTGTTSNNKDVAAYGYLAPPKSKNAPQLVVGVWMGNSDGTQYRGKGALSLESSAPLWSAILTEVSHGLPIVDFVAPKTLEKAKVDAFSGMKPGPFTIKTVTEYFLPGTVPTAVDDTKIALDVDAATGDLWQEGCAGPMVTRGFLNVSSFESGHPTWQKANANWAARAARGTGVRGGPKGTRTMYLYLRSFAPFGATWGAPFPPKDTCALPEPSPEPSCIPFGESPPPGTEPPVCEQEPAPSIEVPPNND